MKEQHIEHIKNLIDSDRDKMNDYVAEFCLREGEAIMQTHGRKTIEQLESAPFEIREALLEWLGNHELYVKLHDDIRENFPSPLLTEGLVAIKKLIENYTKAEQICRSAGYTSDDAYRFYFHHGAISSTTE